MDCSLPGSSVHRIFQARVLEWGAIAFAVENIMLLSHVSRVRLLATPWTAAYQAPPSTGFSRQEYWSGVPSPSPRVPLAVYFRYYELFSAQASKVPNLILFYLEIGWDWGDGSEKAMAPHSSTLAWKTPWMEEPGRLQSMGSGRVGHD